MEKIDPDVVELPGWYRPNPGFAKDLAYVAFATVGGELVARQITNFRWALSAFGTASAANLGRSDTVYCLTPLHHQSGLLVSLGGAVVGGTRIALSRGLRPDRFVHEIRQYGVTVVSYTWAMLREVIDDPSFALNGNHPVRLFIGSGMPTGLWKRVEEEFEPAHVVEFFATTDGQAVLANVSGAKIGSEGRPLPGGGHVELAAYDVDDDLILEDDRGFVRAGRDPTRSGCCWPTRAARSIRRRRSSAACSPPRTPGCRPSTCSAATRTATSGSSTTAARSSAPSADPSSRAAVNDALGRVGAVDLAVTYRVEVGGQQLAVTALTLRPGGSVPTADLNEALAGLPVGAPPDLVHVVPDMTLSASYRPLLGPLRAAGIPKPSRYAWYLDDDTNGVQAAHGRRAGRADRVGRRTN